MSSTPTKEYGVVADANSCVGATFTRSRKWRTLMKLTEKLELAQWMRDVVVPVVRAKGKRHAAEVR